MKKKRWLCLFLTAAIIGGYIAFQYNYNLDKNTAPEITFEEDMIKVKTDADETVLLEGVKAHDKEDGDLTKDVLIDSISAFNSDNERTITYVVFDKDNKPATASRKLTYKNYRAPRITLNDSLIQSSLGITRINNLIGARSFVDGNIDANVEIKMGTYEDHKMPFKVSVCDSTGTQTTLDLVYEYDNTNYTADIVLEKYILYVSKEKKEKESKLDLKKNVEKVMVGNNESEDLLEHVVINKGELDLKKPGVYEIYYSLDDEVKLDAKCKAIVVVQ
ncbi:MAG: hypothetical protein Q4E53_14060 [Eubacteriales bacterium]|nr:hypothetical protein [Eubacteriales bacterium]